MKYRFGRFSFLFLVLVGVLASSACGKTYTRSDATRYVLGENPGWTMLNKDYYTGVGSPEPRDLYLLCSAEGQLRAVQLKVSFWNEPIGTDAFDLPSNQVLCGKAVKLAEQASEKLSDELAQNKRVLETIKNITDNRSPDFNPDSRYQQIVRLINRQ